MILKKLSALLMLLGVGAFAVAGCEPSVEEEAEDVVEARDDVREEQSEVIEEVEGEVVEGNQEITDEQEDLVEENQELNQAIDEETTAPSETAPNVEGDADAIEEVEPQN